MTCETVKIQHNNKEGYYILNKEDYDPKVHTLYNENKQKQVDAETQPIKQTRKKAK